LEEREMAEVKGVQIGVGTLGDRSQGELLQPKGSLNIA
jgi:hypothetical protein